MNPRMLWFCQSVAVAISAVVAPSFRRRSSRTIAFLVPARSSSFPAAGRAAFLAADLVSIFTLRFFRPRAFNAFLVAGLAALFVARAFFGAAAAVLGTSVAVVVVPSIFI